MKPEFRHYAHDGVVVASVVDPSLRSASYLTMLGRRKSILLPLGKVVKRADADVYDALIGMVENADHWAGTADTVEKAAELVRRNP